MSALILHLTQGNIFTATSPVWYNDGLIYTLYSYAKVHWHPA